MPAKSPFRAGRDMDTLIENVELLTGQRGDGRYAATTQSDLARLKLAKARIAPSGGGFALETGVTASINGIAEHFKELPPQHPDRPQDFQAHAAFSSVLLEWRMPSYRGHSLTEVYRGETDNLADAIKIATAAGQVYSDPVNPGWKGYYWIRFVNSKNDYGAYNALEGTFAETIDTDAFFDKVESEISRSPLISDLNTRGSKAFLDMWSQKTSAAGIKTGIGIVAGTDSRGKPISQVAISASQFFVYDPNRPSSLSWPFIVDGGRVLINSLIAKDAVIQTVKTMSITADYVRAGVSLTAPVIRSGRIENGKFTVDASGNLTARDAQLTNLTARGISAYDLQAVRGTLSQMHILEDCIVEGKVSASHIEGDVATIGIAAGSVLLKAMPFSRTLMVIFESAGGPNYYGVKINGSYTGRISIARLALREDRHNDNIWTWSGLYALPARQTITLVFDAPSFVYFTFKN